MAFTPRPFIPNGAGFHAIRPLPARWRRCENGRVLGLRKKTENVTPPEQVYAEHRWAALQAGRDGAILRLDAHPGVYGLVTDFARNGRWTTVVALGDYKASVFYSTGGGVQVVTEVAPVAEATWRLLSTVQDHLADFDADDDGGYPPFGAVRFHLLTGAAGRYADVPDDVFWGRAEHPLRPVRSGVHAVLAKVRETESFPRSAQKEAAAGNHPGLRKVEPK